MPRNGSGIYTLPPVYLAQPGTNILSVQHNTPLEDVASAVTNSVAADGQTPMRGNLRMGGNRVTGLAEGAISARALALARNPPLQNAGRGAERIAQSLGVSLAPAGSGYYSELR